MSAVLDIAFTRWRNLRDSKRRMARQEALLQDALSFLTPGELTEYARMTEEEGEL